STYSVLITFFFACGPPPQDLNSFPTRRSSDLMTETLTREDLALLNAIVAESIDPIAPPPSLRDRILGQAFATPQNTRTVRANEGDRKSTRLNSSHLGISYAVFCLKKKTHKLLH